MELKRQLHMKRVPRKTTNKIISTITTAVHYNFFFLNLTDATREGDAERLIRCFKFVFLVEYQFRDTKYAYLLLHFFAKVYALLSKREAMCLVHNTFFNSEGKKRGNKPLDLQMEHLNFLLKMVLKSFSGHTEIRTKGSTFPWNTREDYG